MKQTLLALMLVRSPLVEAQLPKSVEENVVDYLRGDGSNAELHVVTPEIREKVVEQLRQYAKGYDPRLERKVTPDADAWVALVRLRDPETVQKFVLRIKEWAAGEDQGEPPRITELADTRDPSFVATFSEDFLREDGVEIVVHKDDDVSWFRNPRSIEVAINVLKLIAASPKFNQETRTWAKTWGDSWSIKKIGVSEFRNALRVWWKENEQSLKVRITAP